MNALVIGSGATVWDDLRQVPDLWWQTVIVTNDIGCYLPGDIDHWCSLHPEKFDTWEALRELHGGNVGAQRWTRVPPYDITKTIHGARQVWHPGGSSGMLAVQVAREIGAKRIVLAGVPLDATPHFCRGEPWRDAHIHQEYWESWHAKRKLHNVRSLSGWTRKLLGPPNWTEWPRPKYVEDGLKDFAPSS